VGSDERGWVQVEPRLEWAAARWRGGHTNFDLLALGTSGALAWKIIHRHADALSEKIPVAAVLLPEGKELS
jgi:hypothetical protein